MASQIPVVAAVPTYNMAQSLQRLIPQLLNQNYDYIFILDDSSTDETANVIKKFSNTVEYKKFKTNIGSAGNRNRIIDILQDRGFPESTIINFIDADIVFEPSQPKAGPIARSLIKKYPKTGIITVNILNNDGSRSAFNYGPMYTHKWLTSVFFLLRLEALVKKNPQKAQHYWTKHYRWFKGFPNPLNQPKPIKTEGVVECFTIIQLSTFKKLGGYDPKLRYLEASDFSRKLKLHNLEARFDPILTVRHTQVDVRGWRRYKDVLTAQLRISWKYVI